MNLRPAERAQLTALLGALSSGLSGNTGYSIFSGIQDQISSRRDQERQRKLEMLKFQMDQQAAQAKAEQDQLKLALQQQQLHQSGLSDLYGQLVGAANPAQKTSTSTKIDPLTGKPTTTTYQSGSDPADFSTLMTQLGALAPTVPGGISAQEMRGITGSLDQFYSPPTDAKAGFWTDIQRATMAGMQQGHDPATITNELLRYAAESGFGSPEEQNQVAVALTEMMNAQGYNSGSYKTAAVAPVPPALGPSQPTGSDAGQKVGAVAGGIAGGALGTALIPIPGIGTALGSLAGSTIGGSLGSGVSAAPTVPAGQNMDWLAQLLAGR